MALLLTVAGRIVIVLDEENVERVQNYDPCEIDYALSPVTATLRWPPKVVIAYARREEYPVIRAFGEAKDLEGLWKYLNRGFELRPSDAQRTQPYEDLMAGPKGAAH